MNPAERYTDPEGRFSFAVPPGWSVEADPEEGGVEAWDDEGPGNLHLLGFDAPDDDFPDPAEELYAFLEDRGVELEEDEVDDLELEGGGELAFCEYEAQDEEGEDDETLFWMVGVATMPGVLVFATYFCPAGEEGREREAVRGVFASLRLSARD